MKGKILIIILAVVSVVLLVVLIQRSQQAAMEKKKDQDKIVFHSNAWQKATTELTIQQQANQTLESELNNTKAEITNLTTTLTQVSNNLAEAQAALQVTRDEVKQRDIKIADLELRNQALDKQTVDLSDAITSLNAQIENTKAKLAASEGDRVFLERELKRLMQEKADLERQFNNLDTVRAQFKKLRRDFYTSKRLEWFNMGVSTSEPKGAQKMMGTTSSKPKHYDLNVEVKSDGSVNVISPMTNAPAAPSRR
jgi:chromosome segregation ATPase